MHATLSQRTKNNHFLKEKEQYTEFSTRRALYHPFFSVKHHFFSNYDKDYQKKIKSTLSRCSELGVVLPFQQIRHRKIYKASNLAE